MPQTHQHFAATNAKTQPLDYLLYLPDSYENNQSESRLPLILFLHGAGERAAPGGSLDDLKDHELPKLLEGESDFPCIVIAPQCPANRWWSVIHDSLIALLDHTIATYRADTERVYLTGLSMGGFGAFHLAFEHSQRFAAIAPICGWMTRLIALADYVERLRDMPTWIFHGEMDSVVPCCGESPLMHTSEAIAAALDAAGAPVKFTLYPDLDHNSWSRAYNSPEFFDWLLSHKRSEREKD